MGNTKHHPKGWLVTAVFALALQLVIPFQANAAAPNSIPAPTGPVNFSISPPAIATETLPGKPVTVDVRVQNQANQVENMKATLMTFSARGETGLPDLSSISEQDEFGKWAQLTPATFTAEPNEWKTVKLTITPPADAAFGYYYAVVFSREGAETRPAPGSSNLLGAVASLVLLDVKAPGAVRKLEVDEFSTKSRNTEFLPVNFNVRLKNTGNTHVGVSGTITISKGGKQVSQIDVNESKGYILPDSVRNFKAGWTDGTPAYKPQKDASGKPIVDANGVAKESLSWDNYSPGKLRFGKYEARLVMVYDDGQGDVSTEARLSFWVIPWRIIIAGAFVGILILGGLWALVIRPLRSRLRNKNSRGYAGRR